jgi:poly-gamma-glutamate synthesis protein (capsule biosynthesis protein)
VGVIVLGLAGSALLLAWRREDPRQVMDAPPVAGADEPGAPSSTEAPTTTAADPSVTTGAARGPLGSGEAVTLAFVGDMNFEGPNRARLDADPSSVLAAIAPVLQRADVAVGNLETAVGTAGAPWPGKEFTFQAPPRAIDALRAAGLDVVSMANNHGMDHGVEGLTESLAVKRAQPDGFVIGIGGDEDEAYAPFTTVVRGQRIAVIGATQVIGSSMIDAWTATPSQGGLASAKRVDRLVQAVADARSDADTVVVFLHWGVEKDTCPSADQQALAATLTSAGADIVVGGHAHRVQGAGRLGSALVGYGLGNFLWSAQSAESATTGVLEVTVTGRRVDRYDWVPARIEGGTPRPLDGPAASEASARWQALRACTGLAP